MIDIAGPQDIEALLRLINLIQPQIPWTEEYLHWQYFEHCQAKVYVVREDDKIVSMYAAIGQRVWNGERVIPARMIQDVMTDPEYRGRGYMHKLAQRCVADMQDAGEFGYTFPNQQSEQSFRRTGWLGYMPIPLRIKEVSGTDTRFSLREVSTFGRQSEPHMIGVLKDADYLNWRYSKPGQAYKKFSIALDNGGSLVLKRYGKTLHICELNCSDYLVSPVLDFCESIAHKSSCERITAWVPVGHPYAADFHKFRQEMTNRYMLVYPSPLCSSSEWHMSQGDSDVY